MGSWGSVGVIGLCRGWAVSLMRLHWAYVVLWALCGIIGAAFRGEFVEFYAHVDILGLNGVDKGILEFGWFIGFNGIV